MKNPNTRPQPAQGQELDPLEELARIMNDTNTPNPNKQPQDASADDAAVEGDPLDLGLGDQGLEELFQNQSFGSDDLLAANDLDPAVPQGPDDLLSTLDFSDLNLPPLDEPSLDQPPLDELPLPNFEATNQLPKPDLSYQSDLPHQPDLLPPHEPADAQSLPSLTEHLTPRLPATPEPAVEPGPPPMAVSPVAAAQPSHVGEDDLLAAMDALALDEPNRATNTTPPLSSVDMAPQPQFQPQSEPQPAPAITAPAFDDGQAFAAQSFDDATNFQDNDPASEGRTGLGRKVIYALAGVAVLGLGGVFAFGLFSGDPAGDGTPQLIAAAEGDNKVEPEVASETPARPGDAAFSALESDGVASGETPRVVLPSPTNEGLPIQSSQRLPSADIAPAPPGSTASRAVRTVTVRADGTVVESTSQPVAEAPDVQVPEVPVTAPRSVETVSVTPGNGPSTTSPLQAPVQQTAPNGQASLQAALEEAAQTATQTTPDAATQTPVGQVADRIAASLAPPQPVARPGSVPVQTQPIQIAPTQPGQPSQPVQSTRQVEPIQLATPAAAPTQTVATPAPQPAVPQQATTPQLTAPESAALPASVPAGEFIVQLASLRSEEEARATFARLQNRFGSILSGFSPNIQRADLGERGIYHRVRLGPMDRAAADSLCSRYQSAGGDCFVQRQ